MSTNTLPTPAVVSPPRAQARISTSSGAAARQRHHRRAGAGPASPDPHPRQLDWADRRDDHADHVPAAVPLIFADTVQATLPGGVDAVNYLVAGIIVQGLVSAAMNTGLGLARRQEGLMDRFASLPMSRSAVVFGRILADMGDRDLHDDDHHWRRPDRRVPAGSRHHRLAGGNRADAADGVHAGVARRDHWPVAEDGEAVNSIGFSIIFPLTFVSSTFINRTSCLAGCRASPRTSRSRCCSTPPAAC